MRRSVDADGIAVGDLRLGWPRLSLWRAPTDNDDPPGAWRPTPGPADAWRAAGLDRLTHGDVEIRRRGTTITRIITYPTASGARIVHRQTARPVAGGVELTDDVRIDRSLDDLPRVGVAFTLPAGFEQLAWSGLGPGSSYPDRRAAVRRGTWRSTVAEQRLPFVMPQEHGLHLDTDWLEVASATQAITVHADRPFAFSALHHSVADLTDATHAHRLPERAETFVHLDLAHRGLGMLACGPDTHDRHRLHAHHHRITWTFT